MTWQPTAIPEDTSPDFDWKQGDSERNIKTQHSWPGQGAQGWVSKLLLLSPKLVVYCSMTTPQNIVIKNNKDVLFLTILWIGWAQMDSSSGPCTISWIHSCGYIHRRVLWD